MRIEFKDSDIKYDCYSKIYRMYNGGREKALELDIPTINNITITLENGEVLIPDSDNSNTYIIGVGSMNNK